MKRNRIAALAMGIVLAASPALAESYMLSAGKWGKKQDAAVEAAGGTVVWSHARTGMASVQSQSPSFLEDALATKAFQEVAADMVVQWQMPMQMKEAVITPGDETFWADQWNMMTMDAPAAWSNGCTGAGVRVAVLDGGIYDIHPDLEPNLDKACSASFVPGQAYNTDTGSFWHGTHVAGIVAAADNAFGVIGVAPEATLMHVKVLHSGSGTFGQIIGGILYASDPAAFGSGCPGADIINMSLGAVFFKSQPGAGPLVGAMAKAVNYAGSKGTLVISALGNNGIDLGQFFDLTFVPAESGSGLAVSATGPVDVAGGGTNFRRPASYSNYGEGSVNVAAPGGDFTLFPNGLWFLDMVLSTCRGTSTPPSFSFCFAAGTSMASPAAAGVAALILGANPGMDKGELKEALFLATDDEGKVGHDEFYGHGFVNAYKACVGPF